MEDYQKVVIVGAGLHDLSPSGPPYHLFTEAVLIDKTHPHGAYPVLYQVSQAPISEALIYPSVDQFLSLQDNAFILMGEVLSVDRRGKIIHLADGHTVSYNYLIVMSGNQSPSGEPDLSEYTPGVQALMDAMKLHQRLKSTIQTAPQQPQHNPGGFVRVTHPDSPISQLATLRMAHPDASLDNLRSHLLGRDTRLFQVET